MERLFYGRFWGLFTLFCFLWRKFIVSEFIDTDTCPWLWLKILCGKYPIWTCRFASTAGLRKVVGRVSFFYCTCNSQFIDSLQEHIKSIQCIVVFISFNHLSLNSAFGNKFLLSYWLGCRGFKTVFPRVIKDNLVSSS